jgi:hypothetical protein
MIASLSEPKRAQEVPRLIKRGAHKMSPATAGLKNEGRIRSLAQERASTTLYRRVRGVTIHSARRIIAVRAS